MRLFLVGCPRSGTTLLQSMISAHPNVFSLPETHFFRSIRPKRKIIEFLKMTDHSMAGVQKLLELGCNMREIPKWPWRLFVERLVQAFVILLDEKANREQADAWLEKTPIHLHYINLIERYIPDALFVHIIREGKETIASLYEVTNQYPEMWGGKRSIVVCLNRWMADVQISLSVKSRPNHYFVFYDALIENPEAVLKNLCERLGLIYKNIMVDGFHESFEKIRVKDAFYTNGAGQQIYKHSQSKFDTVLSNAQRSYVFHSLKKNNLLNILNFFYS